MINPSLSKEPSISRLLEVLKFQMWVSLFVGPLPSFYSEEVVEFYTNMIIVEEGTLSTLVKGTPIVFDVAKLGHLLNIPTVRYFL